MNHDVTDHIKKYLLYRNVQFEPAKSFFIISNSFAAFAISFCEARFRHITVSCSPMNPTALVDLFDCNRTLCVALFYMKYYVNGMRFVALDPQPAHHLLIRSVSTWASDRRGRWYWTEPSLQQLQWPGQLGGRLAVHAHRQHVMCMTRLGYLIA